MSVLDRFDSQRGQLGDVAPEQRGRRPVREHAHPSRRERQLEQMFGVLADAFVVRMTLVPAVMALLGHRAWQLPRGLDKVVPEVDIEGERLAARA